jgi:hypothetical protein
VNDLGVHHTSNLLSNAPSDSTMTGKSNDSELAIASNFVPETVICESNHSESDHSSESEIVESNDSELDRSSESAPATLKSATLIDIDWDFSNSTLMKVTTLSSNFEDVEDIELELFFKNCLISEFIETRYNGYLPSFPENSDKCFFGCEERKFILSTNRDTFNDCIVFEPRSNPSEFVRIFWLKRCMIEFMSAENFKSFLKNG